MEEKIPRIKKVINIDEKNKNKRQHRCAFEPLTKNEETMYFAICPNTTVATILHKQHNLYR